MRDAHGGDGVAVAVQVGLEAEVCASRGDLPHLYHARLPARHEDNVVVGTGRDRVVVVVLHDRQRLVRVDRRQADVAVPVVPRDHLAGLRSKEQPVGPQREERDRGLVKLDPEHRVVGLLLPHAAERQRRVVHDRAKGRWLWRLSLGMLGCTFRFLL